MSADPLLSAVFAECGDGVLCCSCHFTKWTDLIVDSPFTEWDYPKVNSALLTVLT